MPKLKLYGTALALCLVFFAGRPCYPAATLVQGPRSVQVRVLVAENQPSLQLTIKGPYQIRLVPGGAVVKKAERLIAAAVPTPKGIRIGSEEWNVRGLWIEPVTDRDLFLGKSRFRGTIGIYKDGNRALYAINRVDVEKYLYGVLHHEVAYWWPVEALKAQAIAARTYALYQTQVSRNAEYDLKSSTSSQVYGGSTTERFRPKKAVDQTSGKVLAYSKKIFPAYFHATCAGVTAGAQELWKVNLPPISGGVQCSYCRLSPHLRWETRVALSEIEEKLNQNSRSVGQILKIEIISQTPSHRAGSLQITGTLRETVIAAKDFRVWVGGDRMRSTDYTVQVSDDAAEFKGKGWGHGVGLCQWGTFGQSLLGRTHEEILQFYYPGSEIVNWNDIRSG